MSIKPGIGDYLIGLRCDENKIKRYLMSSNPEIIGNDKRAFFESFGFSRHRPAELIDALLRHGSQTPIDDAYADRWGEYWECTGPLPCPDGRMPTVRTVWIKQLGESDPTLVTAVPD